MASGASLLVLVLLIHDSLFAIRVSVLFSFFLFLCLFFRDSDLVAG